MKKVFDEARLEMCCSKDDMVVVMVMIIVTFREGVDHRVFSAWVILDCKIETDKQSQPSLLVGSLYGLRHR